MCILFMYIANVDNDSPVKGRKYKLILASNRDEKYSRPSAQAGFWNGDDSHILAGQDLEELGTWLGVSKYGKLAVLLNIMGKPTAKKLEATSRGTLVTGFLRSPPELPGCMYLKNLCKEPENLDILEKFNRFHLITIDLLEKSKGLCYNNENGATRANQNLEEIKDGGDTQIGDVSPPSICVTYLSNSTSACASRRPRPHNLTPPISESKFHAFGNSVIGEPFQKVTCGRKEFEKIVNEHNDKDDDLLVDKLLHFLKSEERFFPDENMENRAKETQIPSKLLPCFSSIFVKLSVPGINYGTRTHTIILVDTENNITFHEWTMKEPIDPHNVLWLHVKHTFKINHNKL